MKKIPEVFSPATWTPADILAIQSCVSGTATPEQQQRAIAWIVYNAANTDDVEYRTDSRDHAFASGRRFVGLQIRKLMALNSSVFSKNQEG
jgi:hypothetical protein